jgi:DNA polymerase-1
MVKKERIFAVDGNFYLYRAFATLRTNRPIEEALPYHFLSMVCKDALAVRAQYLCVAFDGDQCFRYEIYPEYKSDRERRKQTIKQADDGRYKVTASSAISGDMYDYLPNIFGYLAQARICFYQPERYEADDVLCSIAHTFSDRFDIICGAIDKDAYQYLKEGVCLYNSINKGPDGKPKPIFITHESDYKGVPCNRMLDYQTLVGDRGDSIPCILTPKKAQAIIEKFDNLNDWFKASTGDERAFIRAHMEDLRRNRKLTELAHDVLPPNTLEEWKLLKKIPKIELPQTFHAYHSFVWPKTKGLFR